MFWCERLQANYRRPWKAASLVEQIPGNITPNPPAETSGGDNKKLSCRRRSVRKISTARMWGVKIPDRRLNSKRPTTLFSCSTPHRKKWWKRQILTKETDLTQPTHLTTEPYGLQDVPELYQSLKKHKLSVCTQHGISRNGGLSHIIRAWHLPGYITNHNTTNYAPVIISW